MWARAATLFALPALHYPEDDLSIAASEPRHRPELDGIRGLAILLVMLFHFEPLSGAPRITRYGWAGVDLFFVLSGFLITGILLEAKGRTGYFRRFYARRVLRIWPLYLAFVAIAVAVSPGVAAHQAWLWTHSYNWLVALNGTFEVAPVWIGHLWSLAVEEQFYLVWPVIVLLVPRSRLPAVCFGLVALSIAVRLFMALNGAKLETLYVTTPARLDALALGSALAAMGDLSRWRRPALVAIPVLTVGLFTGAVLTPDGPPLLIFLSFSITIIALVWAATLVLAVGGGLVGRVFARRELGFVGVVSYGLYVIHVPVHFWAITTPLGTLSYPLYAAAAGAITLAIAVPVYYLYERRFLALKRFVPMPRPVGTLADPVQPLKEGVGRPS